ncbi:putative LOC107383513-like protein [Nothobranchius furzeri]|uniref:LOC107383513-like protein n=1 Tax=Nothobranchius furzeri TaxID=105023 RepID=A0A9D2YL91_NOTFU|nr:uncharacterized protein LOC107383513 [Nothobranchius furzeri]XP_054602962.1 uncharacterized protein LOC107383513 [Nothobranchius furzeri]KAF7222047.1 putative LOC107383513-like protein [Nothobranchius furzeri]
MGQEAENIFRSFVFDDVAHRDDFDRVLAKLNEYFIPRRNVIHERACFHQRTQRPGEKVETFIRALYELSEHCEFGAARDENTRDRIVVGVLDKEVSRKLQLAKDLTLTLTIETVRQAEEITTQINLQGGAAGGSVNEIKRDRGKYRTPRNKLKDKAQQRQQCGRCGKPGRDAEEMCPARGSTCNSCQKVCHWRKMCRTKKVVREVVTELADQPQSYFLGAVNKMAGENEHWFIKLLIGLTPLEFKIDTGADVKIISEEAYLSITLTPLLQPTHILLDSPGGGGIKCIGRIQSSVTYKGKKYLLTAYDAHGRSVNNLLSREKSVEMKLVRIIEEAIHQQVRPCGGPFGDYGTLKTEPVKIELKENVAPYAVFTARRVPLPMLPKVKEELQRMEKTE